MGVHSQAYEEGVVDLAQHLLHTYTHTDTHSNRLGVHSQAYEEGVVDLAQHLLLVVDVLLLLETDHVGDPHLLQGQVRPTPPVLDQEDPPERPRA